MIYGQQRLVIVFVVGWVAYASTYFLRKPLGVVSALLLNRPFFRYKKFQETFYCNLKIKSDMEAELGFTKSQLGVFDSALLLPYALVQVSNFILFH
jgi:sugar phosphate permease